MAEAATSIGIASFGIQVCQGLLTYYDGWRTYHADIHSAHEAVASLTETLTLLKACLQNERVEQRKQAQVERCLQECRVGLMRLAQKSQELRKYGEHPDGFRQKTLGRLQKAWYPVRGVNALEAARRAVNELGERLELSVLVLQLDVSTELLDAMRQIAIHARQAVGRAAAIEAQHERLLAAQHVEKVGKIVDWLAPPDPWTNHASARQRYEPQTGVWLLRLKKYEEWKAGDVRCLWLYGKAGCGKTILCSTVVEDIRMHCDSVANSTYALFYCSFSDNQKQSYYSLLRSLVVQLGWKGPGFTMLVEASEKADRSMPSLDDLEKILFCSIESFDKVFILLDALDECPEDEETRQIMLKALERLSQGAANLRILVTSREVSDVRYSMGMLGADAISVGTDTVDADIHKWVSTQLSRDRRLIRLEPMTKALIEKTISQKADGMFRWAYCQLDELKRLKSTRPKYVKEALSSLPPTLDDTYERMLSGIEVMYRKEAHTLLKWVAFAQSPPTLGELAEAAIIDPFTDGEVEVDVENRGGGLTDTIDILSGLVTAQRFEFDDTDGDDIRVESEEESEGSRVSGSWQEHTRSSRSVRGIHKDTKIRLAHFSVKEYLESKRILQSRASMFHLTSAKEHRFLAQSCLAYLMHYSGSEDKTSTERDLLAFPLLKYAAEAWYYHSSLQEPGKVNRETWLLNSMHAKRDWLMIHQPDRSRQKPFERLGDIAPAVYYASFMGLERVVEALLRVVVDINAEGGTYRHPLQAASIAGEAEVVKMLLEAGANVNAQGGRYGNALQAASTTGQMELVKMLLDAGADINARGGRYGSALVAASREGHIQVVEMLIIHGACKDEITDLQSDA